MKVICCSKATIHLGHLLLRLFLLGLCCWSPHSAALEYRFETLDNTLELLDKSSVYFDPQGKLQLHDVLHGAIPWQENGGTRVAPPDSHTAVWVKIQLANDGGQNYYRYMAIDNPLFDSVDVFYIINGDQNVHYQAGEVYPFAARPIRNRNFIFPINLDSHSAVTIYFRLLDVRSNSLAITLVSPDYYAEQDQMIVAGLALYAGIMCIIFIYHLAIYAVIRQREFLSYSLFVLTSTIFILIQHGISYQYFWPEYPGWALVSDPVLLMMSAASSYWFLLEFCHLKSRSPFFYTVLSLFIVLQFFLVVGYVFLGISDLFEWAIRSLIPGLVCQVVVVIMLSVKGSAAARSFALAWVFCSVGTLAQVLDSLSFIEGNLFTENGFMLGNIFYVLILSFSLASLVQKLESERIQAVSLNKTKSEFFAKMSHELRTPIHGVLGLVELLIDTPMNDFQKRYINLINITGKSLLSVVNDLLDYSKIEAGEMELNEENFSLTELTEEVAAIFSHNYKDSNVPLRIDIASLEVDHIYGDKEKIKQVLVNLVSNAFKFTQAGEVTVRIRSEGEYRLCFQVSDTGLGISDQDLRRLFDAFYQVKKHQSGIKGTGLGLTICHQMVGLMGGNISVESELGKGSIFSFSLLLHEPVMECTEELTSAQETAQVAGDKQAHLNILVAEDNMTNQIVMQGMLKKLGHQITIVENGREALDALCTRKNHFDLVLMDHDMPVMNGINATMALRRSGSINRDVSVVAMTAHNSEEVRSECLFAGMNDFISKPVSLAQLQQAIERNKTGAVFLNSNA